MRPTIGDIGRVLARAAVALCLLAGLAVVVIPAPAATAAPSVARLMAALTDDGEWDDDDYDWYRQSIADIALYDTEPEVRAAAQTALDLRTTAALKAFVDTGWASARTVANQRKAKNRKQVQDWAKTGTPTVKDWAKRALADGDYAIGEFVAYGHELAVLRDQPVEDSPAEQARIRTRVEQMVDLGGPTVMADGMAALGSDDPAVIAEFYRTGYAAAHRIDFDNRESIRAAVEARNNALEEMAGQARTAAAAASARAEILAANIQAMKLLDDALIAMQLGAKASRRADVILEEDKPGRKNGQRGRTADIEALKAEATAQARRASAAATETDSTIATVQTAAAKLIRTGQSHGVDWAKVTIAAGSAIQAAALGAETSQHAATATLADSLALDADANAELHANNSDRWLASAKKQAETAKRLADVAKAQQKVAEDAAARARTQRVVAEAAARRAGEHAARARTARIAAQAASSNAISRSNAAMAAHGDAVTAAAAENKAITRVNNAALELSAATDKSHATEAKLKDITAELQRARDEAIAAGKDADVATADIAAAAGRARTEYEAAQGWAARARDAAATARAEAQQTTAAANQARAAALNANREAATARQASDKAGLAAQGAFRAAETATLDAQRTQSEATAAVQESSQAVFQSQVADRAAGAAAASAELAVDRAGTADYIAAQFAEVNGDARRIMQVTAEAIVVSRERQAAAQVRADEASAAAARATEAAERAVGNIKPAYEAAASAVESAKEASAAAVKAHNAAVDATNQANGANQAAGRATQYENSAWGDARIADAAAQSATNAATMAGRAADDADRLHNWAKAATASIHAYGTKLADVLSTLTTEQEQRDATARTKREFEENFKNGLKTVLKCGQQHDPAACAKVAKFLAEKGKQALDAGLAYLEHVARCKIGDPAACQAATAETVNIVEFMNQYRIGIWEGARNFAAGIKDLSGCLVWVVAAVEGSDQVDNCNKLIDQYKALPKLLKDHPFELIHLSVWETNPGKALGLTVFDVGSFFIPGIGEVAGSLAKIISGLEKLLASAAARLANGIGTIQRFTLKMVGETGRLAKLTNVTVKIDGGNASIVDGIAIVDGIPYKLEGVGLKLSGSAEDFLTGTVRIDGGVIRLDGKAAKLENGTVKVEKSNGSEIPPMCGIPSVASAAEPCLGNQPNGTWVGQENGQILTLDKPHNDAAKKAIFLAKQNEPEISPKVRSVAQGIPEATREGWKFRLKDADSLKRKIVSDRARSSGEDIPTLVGNIKDNIRYTISFEFADYASGVQKAMRAMEGQGFELFKFKNWWVVDSKPYKGINTQWYDPETNQYFELQFHTPESFELNKAEHPFYEISRTPGMSPEDVKFWEGISKDMWGEVLEPDGVAALKY